MIAIRQVRKFSTVNEKQMEVFKRLSNWWHPSGPSQMLFTYNYHRIAFLKKHLPEGFNPVLPLQGMKILDIGCGAGFLSESLTRLGGKVVGIDPNITSFTEATTHQSNRQDLKNLQYHNSSVEQYLSAFPAEQNSFDLVTSMEVVEHVNNPQQFIEQISHCAKDGGLIMISTIRRSLATWFTHILMAEKVLRIVPSGTHHYNKFLNPTQCKSMFREAKIETLAILQLGVNWKGQFEQKHGGGNYLMIGRKNSEIL